MGYEGVSSERDCQGLQESGFRTRLSGVASAWVQNETVMGYEGVSSERDCQGLQESEFRTRLSGVAKREMKSHTISSPFLLQFILPARIELATNP